jgi:hypothetical protein
MPSFPVGTPALNLVSQVGNPATTNATDGTIQTLLSDKNGALLARELGGRYYAAAQRGNLFLATTLVAGVTVPAPATTLASKAGMINPLGSGRVVELVAIAMGSITIEVAVKQMMMEFQLNTSQSGGVPTSITKLTPSGYPLGVGPGNPQAFAYTAATMTNAAANTILIPFAGNYATAVGFTPTYFKFDGEITFGPDTCMAITCTAAIAAVNFAYIWAEWPL